MKVQDLELNKMYTDDYGKLYKFDEIDGLLTFYERDKSWEHAEEIFPFRYLLEQDFYEYGLYTEDEKMLAKQALGLGIKVIIKDKNGENYCLASDEIFKDDDGYWVKEKGNTAKWIDANGLPKLLKSSLAEKVTYDEPIYLKDVIK